MDSLIERIPKLPKFPKLFSSKERNPEFSCLEPSFEMFTLLRSIRTIILGSESNANIREGFKIENSVSNIQNFLNSPEFYQEHPEFYQ